MDEKLYAPPAEIRAGDTTSWRVTLTETPASAGWSLAYRFINSVAVLPVVTVADGDNFVANIAAAASATWSAGDYDWIAFLVKGDDRRTIGAGRLRILPNLADAAAGIDLRSHARKVLSAIEATLEGRASRSDAEYEIAGRRIKHIPFPELLTLRDRYRAEVASEDAAQRLAAGLPAGRRVLVRF